jgi:ubiquinone/menaquinone biosynthesis C-methylase UbiE
LEIQTTRNSGILNHAPLSDEVLFQAGADLPTTGNKFEELYISSRKIENRIYTDEQVLKLPEVPVSHIHHAEWEIRKRSTRRLIRYLAKKNKPLKILEIGCGNGWFSREIATIKYSEVTGIDINAMEINQAKRVFKEWLNLSFYEGDIHLLKYKMKFDVIVFAASIQYFYSLKNILDEAFSILKDFGEIHILDSFFYHPDEIMKARLRSLEHYHSIGYEEMANFYFHHSATSFQQFNHKYLFNPESLVNRRIRKKRPFPWIRFKMS